MILSVVSFSFDEDVVNVNLRRERRVIGGEWWREESYRWRVVERGEL